MMKIITMILVVGSISYSYIQLPKNDIIKDHNKYNQWYNSIPDNDTINGEIIIY